MKIAIISDIHENFHNLLKALEIMRSSSVEKILCLGDLINPGIADVLAKSGFHVYSIWGNNDGDKILTLQVATSSGSSLEMAENIYASLVLNGCRIFMSHYPELARPMAKSGEFDAVFYGHDHIQSQEYVGECLVLNPGELSAHKTGLATFAFFDTDTSQAEFINIPDPMTLKTPYVKKHLGE